MKVNSIQRYLHTADYYDFRTVNNDQVGGVSVEYFYDQPISCRIFTSNTGVLYAYSRVPLKINARLGNIRDSAGQLIVGSITLDQGFTYEIASVDPVMNAFGFSDALRYSLVKV